MKHTIAIACIAGLTACAADSQPQLQPGPSSWVHSTRNDFRALPPAMAAQYPPTISDGQAEDFKAQIYALMDQRNTLANNLPRVIDPNQRAEHIASIRKMDGILRELEFRLHAAGRQFP